MPPLGAGSSPPQTHANLITVMLQCNINAALQHPVRSHLVPAPRVAVNRRHLVWSPRSIVRIQAFAAPIGAQTPRQSIGSRAMRLHTGCRAASPLPAIRSPSDAQNIGNICYEQILGHLHLRRSDGHAYVAVRYAVLDCCRNALLGRFLPKLGPHPATVRLAFFGNSGSAVRQCAAWPVVRAKPSGRPPSIGERVELAGASATADADRLRPAPFATGSRAMRLHMDAVEQRLHRRATGSGQRDEHLPSHALCCLANMPVVQRLGWSVDRRASFHRQSDFNTCTIPLITRRSSTRGMPRGLFGAAVTTAPINHRSARTPTSSDLPPSRDRESHNPQPEEPLYGA